MPGWAPVKDAALLPDTLSPDNLVTDGPVAGSLEGFRETAGEAVVGVMVFGGT